MLLTLLMNLGFAAGEQVEEPVATPGLEYTLAPSLAHYTMPVSLAHYTMPAED